MAQLNPNIILAGQQPDVMNVLSRATQTAGMANQVNQQNALSGLYEEQGAGILAGDQNALNALAGLDPKAALGVQQAHLGMDQTRQSMRIAEERLQMARQQARAAAQSRAQAMSEAEAAATAKEIEQTVAQGLALPDAQSWDAAMASDPTTQQYVGQFAQREILAASFLGIKDALEMAQGPGPQSSLGKIQADIEAGLLPEDTPLRAGQQQETIFGPDGQPILQRGGTPPKLTVDAGKNTGFYIRTLDAHDTITELEQEGTRFLQQQTDKLPMGVGNYARSPEFQKFDQARRDFVNAILRRESGAVIADSEFDNANKQYFPQPGDGPEVIKQKRRNRRNAIEGLRVGSGEGAQYVEQQKAIQDAGSGSPSVPPENQTQTSPQAPGAGVNQALDEIEMLLEKYGQ